ncbi:MAG: pitrilysin family protein [Myxococcota bacterium]
MRVLALLCLAAVAGALLHSNAGADPIVPAQRPEEPAATTPAADSPLSSLPVERHTLDNGLRIVLSPDRTVPTVAVAVYYDVGSRNEERGRSGFAHLFEHMMFQGSANVGKGEHFVYVRNRGGSANGTTWVDRTNYFETLPSNELALGLWLESDRMRSLRVTAENFENQRETVKEERRQSYEDRPYALSQLRINELAYGDYFPYAHSTIGDMQDLDNTPLSAVQEFFDRYYKPNNAVLSIAGDFDSAEALRLIEQYFGNIRSGEVPAYNPPAFEPQRAERTEVMTDRLAERPAFHVTYHIPPNRETDHYALEMLALVLGDGDSSRLYQELVKEEEICQQIYVSTDDRRGPDLFSFFGLMAGEHSPREARERIYAALEAVAENGVTEREMQKAYNRVTSYFVFGIESNLSRAQRLAEYEMYYGDANLMRTEISHYLAVSAEDVQRVAGQYFAATNRTVLDVLPARGEAQ